MLIARAILSPHPIQPPPISPVFLQQAIELGAVTVGQTRRIGADASHAWVGVFVPGAGWIDLDPTNDLVVSDEHVVLGWGRDYGDVSPIRGVILGGGVHRLDVAVDLRPLDVSYAAEQDG